MSIPLLRGRDFLKSDIESSPRVAVINEAMAERFWPGVNPVGQSFGRADDAQHTSEIVGVVKNSRIDDVYSPITAAFYVPLPQAYTSPQSLQVRTAGAPQSIAPGVPCFANWRAISASP